MTPEPCDTTALRPHKLGVVNQKTSLSLALTLTATLNFLNAAILLLIGAPFSQKNISLLPQKIGINRFNSRYLPSSLTPLLWWWSPTHPGWWTCLLAEGSKDFMTSMPWYAFGMAKQAIHLCYSKVWPACIIDGTA